MATTALDERQSAGHLYARIDNEGCALVKPKLLFPLCNKTFLALLVVAALTVSSEAGRKPPALDTLTYNKKTITVTTATYTISSTPGELLDIEKIVLSDGIAPTRLNVSAATDSIIHIGPNAFDDYAPEKLQLGSGDGWFIIDCNSLPRNPMYYGGNFWVTNDTTMTRNLDLGGRQAMV